MTAGEVKTALTISRGGPKDKEGSGMENDRMKDDVGKEEERKGGGVSKLRCCVKVDRRTVFTLAHVFTVSSHLYGTARSRAVVKGTI